ncbi:MAG: ChbG/HpnK family deacetylase [Planctomycetota bacterium]|nr:MAG: ChbG/HpnK family deacetylase [Planctomycetota bacterium]
MIRSTLACLTLATLVITCLPMVAAEMIKFDPEKKYLIIHADDAGMSHSVNVGTIESMEKGVVNSASIMMPCPWVVEIAKYAKEHPEKDFGLHLTLNSEWDDFRWGPVAPLDQVPSLVDPDGFLWDNVSQVAGNAKASEVEIELKAQIAKARKLGIPVTHLDTHMGSLVCRADIIEVYARVGIEAGLPILFLDNEETRKEYEAFNEAGATLAAALRKNGLPVLDGLAQFYGGETHQEREASYYRALRELKPGVTQLIIHCGVANEELRAITDSWERRDGDRLIFIDPKIADEIKKHNIELITWRQFHAMQKTR